MAPDTLILARHAARDMKRLADECLSELSGLFDQMYARVGRPSIPPERLLKSMLLMALYSINSERMFCERLRYDMLFRARSDASRSLIPTHRDHAFRRIMINHSAAS